MAVRWDFWTLTSMWFKIQDQQVEIKIFAKPNAKKSAVIGANEQGLLVTLHARPVDGAANKELIACLSLFFRLAKSQVVMRKGKSSKHKVVVIPLTDYVYTLINQKSPWVNDFK